MRHLLGVFIVVLLISAAVQSAPQSRSHNSDAAVFHHLVYIGVKEVDRALGCQAAYGCFYSFVADTAADYESRGRHACHAVRCDCNAYGECIKTRDWCIVRRGLPAWLLKRFPARWSTENRPTYLFGRTDLPNPTHIASLHFLPLMRWMDAERVPPGQALMLWDNVRSAGPGAYGLDLAAALGETRWLPHMRGPIMFRQIRLGEFGGLRLPYFLGRHAPGVHPDAAFQRLADVVKWRHGVGSGTTLQLRAVITRRQRTRILANADALQARLSAAGIEVRVVDFGAMTFEAQVQTVHSAAVLVSVHGADCMNMMFLPRAGCLVEVVPTHHGYGRRDVMRKGGYFNLARLLGKQYVEVVSTAASSIIRDASGQLADWNHVNFCWQCDGRFGCDRGCRQVSYGDGM